MFRLYRWSRRDPAGFHAHKDDVYLGPKDPDEEIPELHFPSLGLELTVLTQVTQMSSLKALSRASFTVIELQSPVEDVLTPTARITENSAHFADFVAPAWTGIASRSLSKSFLFHDGLNDFSPSCRCDSALASRPCNQIQHQQGLSDIHNAATTAAAVPATVLEGRDVEPKVKSTRRGSMERDSSFRRQPSSCST